MKTHKTGQKKSADSLLKRLNINLSPDDLIKLQAMSSEAVPQKLPRGNWAPLYPTYANLRSRGFSRNEAIDWLVSQGAVRRGDKMKALNALKTLAVRKNKEAVSA